jgi:hypothetical protein
VQDRACDHRRPGPADLPLVSPATLLAVARAPWLHSVVRHDPLGTVEVDDPGCALDIDTVEDLHRAQQILAARRVAQVRRD